MNESFTRAELLSSEVLAGVLVHRTKIESDWLERVCVGTRSSKLDVLFFIYKFGPVTKQELSLLRDEDGEALFSRATIDRALFDYEASGAIEKKGIKYFIQK